MRKLLASIFRALRRTLIAIKDFSGKTMRWILGMPEPVADIEETEVVDEAAEAAADEPLRPALPSPTLAERVLDACAARLAGRPWQGRFHGALEMRYADWIGDLSLLQLRDAALLDERAMHDHLTGHRAVAGLPPVRTVDVVWSHPEPADDPVAEQMWNSRPAPGKTRMPAGLAADLEATFAAKRQR